MRFRLRKPYRWTLIYTLILLCFTAFILLDTFVIPRAGTPVTVIAEVSSSPLATAPPSTATTGETAPPAETSSDKTSASQIVVTGKSYRDANIQITIETVRQFNTDIYIADIKVTSAELLKTALASDTYGRNFRASTSSIAKRKNAILAINGDYYGFRGSGIVVRNGILYRSNAPTSGSNDGLLIDKAGNISIIDQRQNDSPAIRQAWQVFSFGPALMNNGEIGGGTDNEVSQFKALNPRTAMGQVAPLHYMFIVSDGRTSRSAGLSLKELAQVFKDRGCTVAYNLDGGGSTTLWFNGMVINNPTDGRYVGERSVSDIVYIGY